MAHFVDGRQFARISGQLIHVPIRTMIRIGLWGGYETGGRPLAVASDDDSVLRVASAPARADLRTFGLTGVDIGETVVTASAQDGRIWDSVTVHVHMPRRHQLPAFNTLLKNYPGDEESSDDFRHRIGGDVDNPQLTNTCTLRLSQAFNYSGQPIPHGHVGLLTVTGGDRRSYAFRVAEFRKYMVTTYGPPDLVRTPPAGVKAGVSRTAFAHRRGIICFEVHFSDATGHLSLWDGAASVHGDYFERAFRVSLWIAG